MTDKGLVARAEAFARIHHKGQFRKGEAAEPYIFHVAEVAFSVKDLGGDEIAQSGAWLHDVVEDCTPSLADIEQQFGSEVANVVSEVTDDKTLIGDLGADSLHTVELIIEFETQFDIEISDDDAETLTTVGSIKEYIEQNT